MEKLQVDVVIYGLFVSMIGNSVSMAKKRPCPPQSSDASDGSNFVMRSPGSSSEGAAHSPTDITSSVVINHERLTDTDQPTPAHCLHGNEIVV